VDKSKKTDDLAKASSKTSTPQLSESELDKATGGVKIDGFLKVPDIKGPSTRDGHDDEIEVHL